MFHCADFSFVDVVNTFEATLNTIKANNAEITAITQQYLVGLSILTHTNNIRAQASCLCRCLDPIKDEEDEEHDGEESDNEAPNNVAEGVSGPSKKRKHK